MLEVNTLVLIKMETSIIFFAINSRELKNLRFKLNVDTCSKMFLPNLRNSLSVQKVCGGRHRTWEHLLSVHLTISNVFSCPVCLHTNYTIGRLEIGRSM